MKKIAVLLTLILSLAVIFCSCSGGNVTETTTENDTTAAPVFEESTYETESVFAQNEVTSEEATTAASAIEEATFSVG